MTIISHVTGASSLLAIFWSVSWYRYFASPVRRCWTCPCTCTFLFCFSRAALLRAALLDLPVHLHIQEGQFTLSLILLLDDHTSVAEMESTRPSHPGVSATLFSIFVFMSSQWHSRSRLDRIRASMMLQLCLAAG